MNHDIYNYNLDLLYYYSQIYAFITKRKLIGFSISREHAHKRENSFVSDFLYVS